MIITHGIPFPPNRYQPALDEAMRLRMQDSKCKNTRLQVQYGSAYQQIIPIIHKNVQIWTYRSLFKRRRIYFFQCFNILDIRVYALGITEEVYEPFLDAISGDIGVGDGQKTPGYDYLQVPQFTALSSVVPSVLSGICTGNKPSETCSNNCIFYVDVQKHISTLKPQKYSCLKKKIRVFNRTAWM